MLEDADPRAVATSSGAATLEGTTMRGATVRLTGARRGDQAIVRANYHPAWEAYVAGVPLALTDVGGQLGFTVPADGDLVVELVYPARRWLLLVAIGGIAAGWLGLRGLKPRAAGPISGRTGAGQA